MFFISAPSVAISFILAIFYLASLVFYAANRQQEIQPVEYMNFYQEPGQQHRCFIYSGTEENISPDHTGQDSCTEDIRILDAYVIAVAERDTSGWYAYQPPGLSVPGICYSLFSRPPPCC